jgi:hypothetical protein
VRLVIYRLEVSSGEGPYEDPDLGARIRWRNGLCGHTGPSIKEDLEIEWKENLKCGFLTVEQLRDWFDDSWDLVVNNCLLNAYEVPEDYVYLTYSGRQVAFGTEHAKLLWSKDMRNDK